MPSGLTPFNEAQVSLGLGHLTELRVIQQTTADNTAKVLAGNYIDKGTLQLAFFVETDTAAFGVVAPGNERWDFVTLNNAGAVTVLTGTPQALGGSEFVGLAALPAGSIPLAAVLVNETASVLITTGDITDMRPFITNVGTAFLELTDTPAAYSSQSRKFSRVNNGETAMEFAAPQAHNYFYSHLVVELPDVSAPGVVTQNGILGYSLNQVPEGIPGHLFRCALHSWDENTKITYAGRWMIDIHFSYDGTDIRWYAWAYDSVKTPAVNPQAPMALKVAGATGPYFLAATLIARASGTQVTVLDFTGNVKVKFAWNDSNQQLTVTLEAEDNAVSFEMISVHLRVGAVS